MTRHLHALIGLALLGTLGCSETTSEPEPTNDCITTEWLSGSGYQAAFDAQFALDCYPAQVTGREGSTELEFQGVFQPIPSATFEFSSRHGATQPGFDQLDANLQAQGFTRVWIQSFTPSDAIERFQATWTKQ